MEEKMIPVIGVPPTLQTFPSKNGPTKVQKPPKKAAKIKNAPAIQKVQKRQEKKSAKKVRTVPGKAVKEAAPDLLKKYMEPVDMTTLITETGLPPSENGAFVHTEAAKLTEIEKEALTMWLDANVLPDPKATRKMQKKHRFKLRLTWLLNKSVMMNAVNIKAVEKKVAKAQKQYQKNLGVPIQEISEKPMKKAEKPPKNPEKKKKEPKEPTIRVDLTHLAKERPPIRGLMDVVVQKPFVEREPGLTEQLRDFYENSWPRQETAGGGGGGGYQYLNEDWYNADKPWRRFQTEAPPLNPNPTSSTDFYTSYSNHGAPTSSAQDPTMIAPWAQAQAYSSMAPMTTFGAPLDFSAPPPGIMPNVNVSEVLGPRLTDSLAQLLASRNQLAPDYGRAQNLAPESPLDPGFVSQYRQAFPANSQPHGSIQQALEVSEEELARQKRLLEIEEELAMINARKMQMQMEEEIRQREFDLALQTQRMQERQMQLREREMFEEEREFSNRNDGYYHQRRSPSYSDRHQYSSSTSSRGHHQQISIDHENSGNGNGRRYGGQLLLQQRERGNKKTTLPRDGGGGEHTNASVKRQADGYGYDQDDGANQEGVGSIRPAKIRKPRHRKNKSNADEQQLQMQAISDDEE